MASPFTVFRRNQKVLLAVTGILAMIAFVFLGTCIQSPGPVQAFENPTVVSWKYGDITEADMADRIGMRRILNHFLLNARNAAGIPVNQNESIFPETEDSVVRSLVLARRGRELGLVISDDMVNRVLAQLTLNRVPPAELERIIANVRLDGQTRITPKQIFDALREELLARHVEMLFLDGLGAQGQEGVPPLDTPAQRWDHFRRLERQATVQVLPVPVAEFTEEVGKPSEEDLQALFEKYKNQFPAPNSPEPGFRQPYRARFEYFKADSEELVTAEMKNVTEEEVREYYEKNKDTRFRKTKLSKLEEDAGKDAADKDAAKSDSADDAKKEAVKDEAAKGTETDAKESEVNKGRDTESADDVKDEAGKEDNASKAADEGTPEVEKSPAKLDQNANDKEESAKVKRDSPFRLVNFQDDKAKSEDSAKQPDKDETKKESKSETASTAAQDKSSADTKTDDTKAIDAKDESAADAADDAKKDAKTDAAADATDSGKDAKSGDAKTDDAKTEPVEYRPLEEVEEEIRRALARERVQKIVEERFTEVRAELNRYAKLRMRWQRDVARNPDEPKPKPLDLQALADKYHLKLFTTELISRLDTANNPDLEIARSYDFSAGTPGRPFAEWSSIAFEKGNLYRPRTSDSLEGSRFLWWKIEEKQGQVPSFSEAREQVLEAWKLIQARDLAKRQAEQYARTVRQAKQPMKEVFAQDKDLPVTEAGPFSWLTRLNVPAGMMQQQAAQIHYPEVPGVLNPTEEFMDTTFHLEPGEVGVAFNHPKSIVYVIQPVSFTPSDSVLEQEFMVRMQDYDRYRAAGGVAVAQAQENWMESLFDEYGVRWHRTADIRNSQFE